MRSSIRTAVSASALGLLLQGAPALAGNFFATGHDADFHCSGGEQCNLFGRAIDFVRQAAPDRTKPVLFLDNGTQMADAAAEPVARAANTVEGAGSAFNFVVQDLLPPHSRRRH